MNWRVVFSIVRKDLVDAIKNMYLLFVMLMPIGMSLMFRVVFPNEQEISQLTIIIFDQENSRLSAMVQAYQGVDVISASSAEQVIERVQTDGAITGGLVIQTGFDAALEAGEKPQVWVYINPNASSIQQGVFRSIIVDQSWLLVRQEFPVELIWDDQQTTGSDANGESSTFNMEVYLLLVVLMMGLAMVGSFVVPSLMVEEKEKHTLEALLVAPGGPVEVTTGKAIVGMIYSLLVAGILLALNNGFAGNWPYTVAAIFMGSLFLVGVGLLMGSAFKAMSQVNIVSSVIMLLMLIPSWVGIFSLPEPLDTIVRFVPTYYVSKVISEALVGDANLANAAPNLALLVVSVLLVYAAVVWLLRRERK